MEYLCLIGATLDVIGKIMVSFTVIMVHHRFLMEHKVDEKVFKEMKREQKVAYIGIALMIIGFLIQIPYKF